MSWIVVKQLHGSELSRYYAPNREDALTAALWWVRSGKRRRAAVLDPSETERVHIGWRGNRIEVVELGEVE